MDQSDLSYENILLNWTNHRHWAQSGVTGNRLGAAKRGLAAARRQTLMFSATWPREVQQLAHSFTDPRACSVIRVTKQVHGLDR
eukprot:5546873-Pyramimonas_sp.AAC.1